MAVEKLNYHFHHDGSVPKQGEVFVFGANLAGRHGRGAALMAKQRFGAMVGVGRGRMGASYAIPTKDEAIRTRPLNAIRREVTEFILYAGNNSRDRFFVTRIGCGLAGYEDAEIAPMFVGAPENCSFPLEWKQYLGVCVKASRGPEDDCPFGPSDGPRREPEPCPRCGNAGTVVDYGAVDDDRNLPPEVQAGMIPIFCSDCGKSFYGNWKSKG